MNKYWEINLKRLKVESEVGTDQRRNIKITLSIKYNFVLLARQNTKHIKNKQGSTNSEKYLKSWFHNKVLRQESYFNIWNKTSISVSSKILKDKEKKRMQRNKIIKRIISHKTKFFDKKEEKYKIIW